MMAQYWWLIWLIGLVIGALVVRTFWKYYKDADESEKPKFKKIFIVLAILSIIVFVSVYIPTHTNKVPITPPPIEDIRGLPLS